MLKSSIVLLVAFILTPAQIDTIPNNSSENNIIVDDSLANKPIDNNETLYNNISRESSGNNDIIIDSLTNGSSDNNKAQTDTIYDNEIHLRQEGQTVIQSDDTLQQDQQETVLTPVDKKQLLHDGTKKKGVGIAMTAIGGTFMVGTITYSLLFAIDTEKFGIFLGSTISGNEIKAYYLNPGLFGLPVAAPCLAVGIVNLIKGNNMIRKSKKNESESSIQIEPYLAYSYTTNTAISGVKVRF